MSFSVPKFRDEQPLNATSVKTTIINDRINRTFLKSGLSQTVLQKTRAALLQNGARRLPPEHQRS
jgi:hypothetical protein